jgi:hypothetical protein
VLVNTLAEAKYFEEPWGVLIIGFGISCAAVIYFLMARKRADETPA